MAMLVEDGSVGMRLGKYRIDAKIGKGGMGAVYAGEDARLRRRVAIKVLGENLVHEDEVRRRFILEARAAAQLNHPNVVTIHDVGQRDNIYYIVMELVEGGSVQTRLQTQGKLHWREATRIVADVCRGLAAAHGAGLIHRDVKPGNILLTATGVAKLADFGLTKAPAIMHGALTQAGTVVGTPQFMSPEHCTGEVLDERTDLYSLGATYFNLLVGRPPYVAADPTLILYSHCSAPVPDLQAEAPGLPIGCAQIVLRAMAKSRSERFQNADEMLVALLAISESDDVEGSSTARKQTSLPPTPCTPQPYNSLRRFTIAGGAVFLAIILLLLCSQLFREQIPASPNAAIRLKARSAPLLGHKGAVRAISIADRRLVSAGMDGTVRIWDPSNGRLLRILLPDNGAALDAIALSPDGKILAVGGQAKRVHFFDAESGAETGTLISIVSEVSSLAFSPNGRQLAVASQSDLQLGEFQPPATFSRRVPLLEKQYVVSAMAFSGDGKRLVACTGDGIVHIWDVASLKHRKAPGTFSGRLTMAALSPDGSRVVFGSHDGVLHMWEPDRGIAPTILSGKEGSIAAAAFARGGALVFAGEWAGPLRVCDLAAGKTSHVPTGVAGVVNALDFSPDGRTLAAACSDGSVRMWDVLGIDEK